MSAERRLIEVGEIRAGDRLRIEQEGYTAGSHALSAAEWTASTDGDVPWQAQWGEAPIYLLDRPVNIPTRPYSLVVHPECVADGQVFVLEPLFSGKCGWYRYGEPASADDVREAIADGWRVVVGPEVIS